MALYPEGFAHYLRHHRVKPPDSFLEHLRRNRFEVPVLPTVAPGSANTPVLLLDVPVQVAYEHELVIRFPARCLGWEPEVGWGRFERLWDAFSDQLDRALGGPASNLGGAASRQSSAAFPRGRVTSYLHPALPYGAAEGSEISQFEMEVDSPPMAFKRIEPLLIANGLIKDVVIAWRRKSAKVYQVIWPTGYCEPFQDVEDVL
jgi:hypothetical protein